MSNIFATIGEDIKVGAEDVAHAVVEVVDFLPKAEQVIATAIQNQPAVKTAVLGLISAGEAVFADGAVVVTDKGVNLSADATALAAADAFFTYFQATFVPAIEALYEQVKTDVQS